MLDTNIPAILNSDSSKFLYEKRYLLFAKTVNTAINKTRHDCHAM